LLRWTIVDTVTSGAGSIGGPLACGARGGAGLVVEVVAVDGEPVVDVDDDDAGPVPLAGGSVAPASAPATVGTTSPTASTTASASHRGRILRVLGRCERPASGRMGKYIGRSM
jgi:hypothetical protein